MINFKQILKKPGIIIVSLNSHGLLKWLDDKTIIESLYKVKFGKKLNLENPVTYNEKLQWIKLYDRNPQYTVLVDKYGVREYIKEKIGEKYLIPLIGVWEKPEDIDMEKMPEKFVLKCTHDSGGIRICKDKNTFDFEEAKAFLNHRLKKSGYTSGREWPYKDVPRRIIAEKYMEDNETRELRDYKFFTFDGEVKALFVARDRQTPGEEVKFDYFDENYNVLPIKQDHQNSKEIPAKPHRFDDMKALAEKLGKGIPHVRVDFYEVNGEIYFGEMTFFHHSGFEPFYPDEWDNIFGSWLKLPEKRV